MTIVPFQREECFHSLAPYRPFKIADNGSHFLGLSRVIIVRDFIYQSPRLTYLIRHRFPHK